MAKSASKKKFKLGELGGRGSNVSTIKGDLRSPMNPYRINQTLAAPPILGKAYGSGGSDK